MFHSAWGAAKLDGLQPMDILAGYNYAFIFQMESLLFFDKVYGIESAAVIYASERLGSLVP